MLRTTAIAKELAVIERKLQETTNKTLKDALKKKQTRLKDELNDFKKSTPALAKQLLAQRAQIKQLSKMDFNDLIRRLSKKPEYSFLRTMSKSTIKTDIERPAKPVGWRFKGRGNYDKPTMAEIKKGKRNGTVYREVRALRSDVSQPLRLETGGMIEIGDKIKLNDDGVIRTYTVTKPGMRHPSERLQDGDVYLTSPGVMGFDASIDWVKKNMIHDKIETGGGVSKKEEYIVAGRPVTLNKGVKSDGTDWTVTFKNGQTVPLSDVVGNIKPFPKGIKMNDGGNMKNTHMMETGGGIELKKKITLHLDSLTDSTYFSSSYGTFRYGYNNIDVVVNMVNKQYGYAKMKGKFAVIDVEVEDIEGNALNKLIFNTKEEAVSYIKNKLTDEDNKFGKGGNMKNAHMMQDGGVIGQEIVFDDNGEENKGVIKDIHEITGNYIVATDDGRTVLADKDLDVISLGAIRKTSEAKKRFSFFEDGGGVNSTLLSKIKVGNIIPTNHGNFEIIELQEDTALLNTYDGGFSYFKVKDEKGKTLYIKISREENPKMFINNGPLYSHSWENAKQIFEDGGNIAKENNEMLHSQAKEAKHHIEELHNVLTTKTKVEPWVVAKMTRAKTDLSDITHYLDGASAKMQNGGKLTDAQQNKFDKVMREWKDGKLHSGSANGPIVKDQDQAIAIAYAEAYGTKKMAFGGMIDEDNVSTGAILRMEELSPTETLDEFIANAQYITTSLIEEGFEKDEVLTYLAHMMVNNVKGSQTAQSTSKIQQWTTEDANALTGWISDIQDGFGWITPGYVEDSWTSRPGSGTKEWNGDIQQRVYQRLIDENMLFAENPNDSMEKGKKIKGVTTAIWTAAEENGYEDDGKMAKGGGVDDCTASYEMFVEFVESSNDEYVQDANIVPYLEMNGVVVSYKQGSKKVAVIVYNPRKEKLSRASVISSVMTMFPKEVQANIGNFSSKYSLKNKNLCSATLIKIVNHNGELIEEFEEFMNGGKMQTGGGVGKTLSDKIMNRIQETNDSRKQGSQIIWVNDTSRNTIYSNPTYKYVKENVGEVAFRFDGTLTRKDFRLEVFDKNSQKRYPDNIIKKFTSTKKTKKDAVEDLKQQAENWLVSKQMNDGGKMSGWKHKMNC